MGLGSLATGDNDADDDDDDADADTAESASCARRRASSADRSLCSARCHRPPVPNMAVSEPIQITVSGDRVFKDSSLYSWGGDKSRGGSVSPSCPA
jgi:hypothetical protein